MEASDLYGTDEEEDAFRAAMFEQHSDRLDVLEWVNGEIDDAKGRIFFGIGDEYEERYIEVMTAKRWPLLFEMWWI